MRKSARLSVRAADISTTSSTDLNEVESYKTRLSLPSFVKRVERLTADQRDAITKLGFGNLLLLSNQMLRHNLLVELMKRWSCEKHAFIFHCGEVSITLRDVVLILGLRVVGKPVILNEAEPFSDLEKEFGVVQSNRKIKITSLESILDSIGESVSEKFVRTFVLFAIGTLLFPSTTPEVDSRYLSFLEDLEQVSRFSWGAAVLEDIIFWLDKRKTGRIKYVGGCLLVLQIWSYEHLDIARPSPVQNPMIFPRACRWANNRYPLKQVLLTMFKEIESVQITLELQPTSEELEVDVVKELVEAESVSNEFSTEKSSTSSNTADSAVKIYYVSDSDDNEDDGVQPESDSIIDVDAVEIDSEIDISDYKSGMQEGNLNQEHASEIESMNHTGISGNPSTSYPQSERDKPIKAPLRSEDSFYGASEDDLMIRCQMLEEKNMALMKENEELRNELLLKQVLEEQNAKLQEEVESLREENEIILLNVDNLVARCSRLLDEDEDEDEDDL